MMNLKSCDSKIRYCCDLKNYCCGLASCKNCYCGWSCSDDCRSCYCGWSCSGDCKSCCCGWSYSVGCKSCCFDLVYCSDDCKSYCCGSVCYWAGSNSWLEWNSCYSSVLNLYEACCNWAYKFFCCCCWCFSVARWQADWFWWSLDYYNWFDSPDQLMWFCYLDSDSC